MKVSNLIKIAITPEEIDERCEAMATKMLLKSGWDRVHLRHPKASRRDMINLIEKIPQEYHSRLVLHGHFDLINEYNLGGLHLNHRCPTLPGNYKGPASRSCHSLDEIKDCKNDKISYSYITLSPIFDSISKSGYKRAFNDTELYQLSGIKYPSIIALGGVTPERLDTLSRFNFSGFAMLGAIPWHNPSLIHNFLKL
ncbi:MAG: thiamine phosphate synthase [Duncaniella sp.]|nr:thiamine phosphate synthase [Duncaniella sp.]